MIQQADTISSGQVWEGTWEAINSHAAELSGHRLRVVILDPDSETAPARTHISARGKYAGLLSSEDITRAKHEDIADEERRR